jgi:MFS family permease
MKYIPSIAVGLGAFIATFDVTAVSLLLPAISSSFSLDIAGYVWVMDAYSLAFTIALMSAGALSDRFGQRLSVVAGALVFLLASVLCAYASGFGALIVGRIIQGIGAGFIVCGGLAWAGSMYKDKSERAQAFAIIGTISGSALAIGPVLGGSIAGAFGWNWVFLLNIPICILIVIGSLGWMSEHRNDAPPRIDVPGTVLVSLLLLASIWLLLHGSTVGDFVVGTIPSVIAIGMMLLAFIRVERRAPNPTIDIALFGNKKFVGLATVPLTLAISYWSLMVFIPVFLDSSMHLRSDHIFYFMLFFTAPMFVVPFLVAKLSAAARQSAYYSAGLLVVSVGCSLVTLGAFFYAIPFAIAGMFIAGVGAATIQSQISGALISSVPQERAGAASAILMVLRQGGFAVACALLSKVLQTTLSIGPNTFDSFTLLFFVCTVAAALGSAATFLLVRSHERTRPVDALLLAGRES